MGLHGKAINGRTTFNDTCLIMRMPGAKTDVCVEFVGPAEMRPLLKVARHRCPHCENVISLKTYNAHKRLYYDREVRLSYHHGE